MSKWITVGGCYIDDKPLMRRTIVDDDGCSWCGEYDDDEQVYEWGIQEDRSITPLDKHYCSLFCMGFPAELQGRLRISKRWSRL